MSLYYSRSAHSHIRNVTITITANEQLNINESDNGKTSKDAAAVNAAAAINNTFIIYYHVLLVVV